MRTWVASLIVVTLGFAAVPSRAQPLADRLPDGALIYVDPTTGSFQSQSSLGASVSLRPIVANSTLYILDNRARLHAFR